MSKFIFGKTSSRRLETCHLDIQSVKNRAIQITRVDFFIACGARGQDAQDEAFMTGASKLEFPESYHNEPIASLADDAVPYVDGKAVWYYETPAQKEAWDEVVMAIKAAALELNIPLEWGFDLWKWDRPHWQLTSYRA